MLFKKSLKEQILGARAELENTRKRIKQIEQEIEDIDYLRIDCPHEFNEETLRCELCDLPKQSVNHHRYLLEAKRVYRRDV